MKILMVCLGNICRSPMAEGVLKELAEEAGLDWTIESAGTNRWHKGGPADARAIRVCAEKGIDLSGHVARRFTAADFEEYDRIYSMAPDVTREIRKFAPTPSAMDHVREFMEEKFPGQGRGVPDPWYDGDAEFLECYRIVRMVCVAIISSIRNAK